MGRTTYPGSSHERVLPVATRPRTEFWLTPPLTFSGEELVEDDEIPTYPGHPDNDSNADMLTYVRSL